MDTTGYYKLYESGAERPLTVLIGLTLEAAYEVATELAGETGSTVNVWRDYGEHIAMLGSVYPGGKVIGIKSRDAWELAQAALG